MFVVTSENQKWADKAKAKWKLPSLELLGDPSLSLARHLKASGLLDVFISVPDPAVDPWTAGHPFMRNYTNGVAQPSILVVSKASEVWFRHAVVPDSTNGGGAVDRPGIKDVWAEVRRAHLSGVTGGHVDVKKMRLNKITDTPLPFMLGAATIGPLIALRLLVAYIARRRRRLTAS